MKILDVGCGNRKMKGAIGIDIDKNSQADIIGDFDTPMPFKSFKKHTFDFIRLRHTIEHSKNMSLLLYRCEQLLKPRGTIEVWVPTKNSTCFVHPEHNYFFEFDSRRGMSSGLPVLLQKFLGLFIPNEIIIKIVKR